MNLLNNDKIVLKITGESLCDTINGQYYPLVDANIREIAEKIKIILELEERYKIGIVLGGGNIYRGGRNMTPSIDKETQDQIGMDATRINARALSSVLEEHFGIVTTLFSTTPCIGFETYDPRQAKKTLASTVNFYAGGTGHGNCTTDYSSMLRAVETGATLLKGTKVEGVYSRDPNRYPDARRFTYLNTEAAIDILRGSTIIDPEVLNLLYKNQQEMLVFKGTEAHNFVRVLKRECPSTIIGPGKTEYDNN